MFLSCHVASMLWLALHFHHLLPEIRRAHVMHKSAPCALEQRHLRSEFGVQRQHTIVLAGDDIA
jgi:hypothetical protein